MFLGSALGSNSVCVSLCQTLKLVIFCLCVSYLFFFPFFIILCSYVQTFEARGAGGKNLVLGIEGKITFMTVVL